ncbi:hypothetical protein RvY_12869-1 [Ramazzottius varieornatus]|uniref:Uncharacterized protein n=1 Tax=Ramazzottius varieornatus TaxID=947166 RepID=A0A1D1VUM0_RAMVA|nr:hypothetical protein RvY_12869-1 [Ramazzottius varieornatus]
MSVRVSSSGVLGTCRLVALQSGLFSFHVGEVREVMFLKYGKQCNASAGLHEEWAVVTEVRGTTARDTGFMIVTYGSFPAAEIVLEDLNYASRSCSYPWKPYDSAKNVPVARLLQMGDRRSSIAGPRPIHSVDICPISIPAGHILSLIG